MKTKIKRTLISILLLWIVLPNVVYATDEQAQIEDEVFSLFDDSEINQWLDEVFPSQKLTFEDVVRQIISGDMDEMWNLLKQFVLEQFSYEFHSCKKSIVHILILVLAAAVLHNFSNLFQNAQIADLSFYVVYILLITICLNSFRVFADAAVQGIGNLLEFLKLLGPVYFMAVAISTGSVTSISFYSIILFVVYLVEMFVQNLLIPLAQIYMVVKVLDYLSHEEFLSKFADLLHTIIIWSLRTLLAGVIGLNVIQGMIGPAMDSVKRSIVTRGGEAIPFIGDAIGGVTEVVLGTTVLIRNGIGVTGALICVAVCLVPIVQMAVVTLMYKFTAAMIQPISEKRVVGCISSMADGAAILLRVVLFTCVLFLITIAMVANTTT